MMKIARRLFAAILPLCLAPAVAQAQNVLVYDNNTVDHVAATACTNLGYSCTVADATDFVTQLTGGTWDMVAMDFPSTQPDGAWQDALNAYVLGGGRAIMTGWDTTYTNPVAAAFEVELTGEHDPLTFYDWASTDLFTTPNVVPTTMVPVDDDWGTNGFYLTLAAAGSGVAAAGFTPAPQAGQGAIVVGNSGRTYFNGFLFDDFYPADTDDSGTDDIIELVENEMGATLVAGALDFARFHVTKTFSDGSDYDVDVHLKCNSGNPLEQDFTITGGDPVGVTFVVANIPDTGANCEVTETSGPAGYTPEFNGGDGCTFEGVVAGYFECEITNTADPATFTVLKDWTVYGEGGLPVDAVAGVTITCDSEIDGGWEDDGDWYLSGNLQDGDTLTAWVDVSAGAATCSADEEIYQSGVESTSVGCGSTQLGPGGSHTCTFTNTVFFEGIPTLSQWGLAILALLTLGVGLVGFRRFA